MYQYDEMHVIDLKIQFNWLTFYKMCDIYRLEYIHVFFSNLVS